MVGAKQEFKEYMAQLRSKKDESKELKQSYNVERRNMILEEKKAQSFKFTKMTKKSPFLPTLHEKKELNKFTSIDAHEKFLDCQKKYFILFPQRAFEK